MKIKSLSQDQIRKYEHIYKQMWKLYLKGKRQVDLATEFNITKQRVNQIINRMKEGEGDYYYKHRDR